MRLFRYYYAINQRKRNREKLVGILRTNLSATLSEKTATPDQADRGRNTGHMGLGIVTLDLESFGEHWGTFFLTPKGRHRTGWRKHKA